MSLRVTALSRIGIPTSEFTSRGGRLSNSAAIRKRKMTMPAAEPVLPKPLAGNRLAANPAHKSLAAGTSARIERVTARAVLAPLAQPIRTAAGTIPKAPLVLIDVDTTAGVTGRSYIFAYTPLALRPLVQLINDLGGELAGKAVAPAPLMDDFNRRFRLLGWQGLIGMAVSGLDMAFWDAIARAQGEPVVRLLGGEPRALPAYDSYGLVDLKADLPTIARA